MVARLKICGITRLEDALLCAELGVDLLGFNFISESPRYIRPEQAAAVIAQLPATVQAVGLVYRPAATDARALLQETGVAFLQVYQPRGSFLQSLPDVPVIFAQAFGEEPVQAPPLRKRDMLLLDAGVPGKLGGTGQSFAWQKIPREIDRRRLVLAGGIRPENIGRALREVHPAVVDVATGAERAPGVKDPEKVRALVEELLRYNLEQIHESRAV